MISLRPYQARAIRLARDEYRKGHKRVLLVAPTGAGKTILLSFVGSSAIERGGRVLVVVHRHELVKQTVDKMTRCGIPRVGVIAAGERSDPGAPVQVGSIQTLLALVKRAGGLFDGEALPPATLIVFDEAHHYTGTECWSSLAALYPEARLLGVTATPERGDGAPLGDLFDVLVVVASVKQLTAEGHLVPCDVIAPPKKTRRNMADPVDAYVQHGGGRKAIVFASSVKEAYELAARYTMAGHPAACVEGNMSVEDRDRAFARFASGELRVLTNVQICTEGFDLPSVEVCVLARGCSSWGTFIQICGRALRPSPETGKTRALIIDLRGVCHEHDLPDADRTYSLEGRGIGEGGGEAPVKTCKACEKACAIACRICPSCGHAFPVAGADEPTLALSKVQRAEVERTYFEQQYRSAVAKGYRKPAGFASFRFKEKFGRFPAKFWKEFGGDRERSAA